MMAKSPSRRIFTSCSRMSFDRRAASDLRQERRALDQRAVGIGVVEIIGQVRVEPLHVGFADRSDVVVVEVGQGREMPRDSLMSLLLRLSVQARKRRAPVGTARALSRPSIVVR